MPSSSVPTDSTWRHNAVARNDATEAIAMVVVVTCADPSVNCEGSLIACLNPFAGLLRFR